VLIGVPQLKPARIGFLSTDTSNRPPIVRRREAFRRGLREQGLIEGKDVDVEFRYADGQLDRVPLLASELLLERDVRLMVIEGAAALDALSPARRSVPIVIASGIADPVGTGAVKSLSRPGGNITGIATGVGTDLLGKRLDLLKDMIPSATRLALLTNLQAPAGPPTLEAVSAAAARLGMQVLPLSVATMGEVEPALSRALALAADSLYVHGAAPIQTDYPLVAREVARNHLPAVGQSREFPDAGGLMGYGPDLVDAHRRAAGFVARILNGANPADMPIEQPTAFDFVVNRTTLTNLGLTAATSVTSLVTDWVD
jgi:putative ABC transport system substrate-binding protein